MPPFTGKATSRTGSGPGDIEIGNQATVRVTKELKISGTGSDETEETPGKIKLKTGGVETIINGGDASFGGTASFAGDVTNSGNLTVSGGLSTFTYNVHVGQINGTALRIGYPTFGQYLEIVRVGWSGDYLKFHQNLYFINRDIYNNTVNQFKITNGGKLGLNTNDPHGALHLKVSPYLSGSNKNASNQPFHQGGNLGYNVDDAAVLTMEKSSHWNVSGMTCWWAIAMHGTNLSATNYALGFHMATNLTSAPAPNSSGVPYYYEKGWITANSNQQMNFTGQHRCILNKNIDENSKGLIVSSTGKYVNIDNSINVTINESLPECIIANTDNDKKVFGVISDKEDTQSRRTYSSGNFVTPYEKTNKNEQRIFINSLGEGAIWVCNKNGTVENGDYISSSSVAGYGMKQTLNEDFVTRYTVAKITCDCDFSLTKIVKQKLKVINQTDSSGNAYTDIDYDTNGDVQYEDDLDENDAQQMIYTFETRFLQADTTQITEAEYNTKLAAGEQVYIACFVGCSYHCG